MVLQIDWSTLKCSSIVIIHFMPLNSIVVMFIELEYSVKTTSYIGRVSESQNITYILPSHTYIRVASKAIEHMDLLSTPQNGPSHCQPC